ncbi:DUF759 family protein, partial [Borrelia persica]|uniref:DUF759 family protein n=1 Tax=Borrelia persica TaxID=44448 RepID=UPI00056DAE56
EFASSQYDQLAPGQALSFRTDKLQDIINDFNSLGISTFASNAEKAKNSLDKAEDSFGALMATTLQPLLKKLSDLVDWLKDFTFKTHIIDPILKEIKNFFGNLNEWLIKIGKRMLKLILPTKIYRWLIGEDPETEESHSPLPSIDTESKLETDASV